MNTKIFVNEYSKSIEEIAKEEYLSARMLYLNFSLRSARTLAHQSIEKLFKAVCLRNNIKIPDYGHDLTEVNDHCMKFIDLQIPEDAVEFINELSDNYNHTRYATRPINITRSEIWLMDKVVISLLRFCHSLTNPQTTRTIRQSNPLRKHFNFPDSSRIKSFESEILAFLTPATILDKNESVDDLKSNFIEFTSSYNTFWDSFPSNQRPLIFSTLDEYIGGFNSLQKSPGKYNDKKVTTVGIKIDGENESSFFKPLSMKSRQTGALNTPPDADFYK